MKSLFYKPYIIHYQVVVRRSLTLGVGSFHWQYDYLQEVPEKLSDRIVTINGNGNGK
jgi:elongation factor G